MTRFTNALAAVVLAAGVCAPVEAARYAGTFGGTTPTGWTDTTGVFGAPGTLYENVAFSGAFTYDVSDWVSSGGQFPDFDANGAPTPGYSVEITLGGVTVGQPDTSSFFNPYIFNNSLGFNLGGWYGYFFMEVDLTPATTASLGFTQSFVDSGLFPSFSVGSSELLSFSHVLIDNGNNGRLAELPLSSFSLTAIPAVPEPATWGMMLIGFGAMGVALRRRRAVALQTA